MEPKLKNGAKNKTKNKKSVDMQHFFQYGVIVRERILSSCLEWHCVKNVPIQSYSGPHFPAFGRSECGKMRTRITPNTDTSRSVVFLDLVRESGFLLMDLFKF